MIYHYVISKRNIEEHLLLLSTVSSDLYHKATFYEHTLCITSNQFSSLDLLKIYVFPVNLQINIGVMLPLL